MKKTLLFIVSTFLVSWLIAGLGYFFVGNLFRPSFIAVYVAYMFVPMAVAITVQKFIYGEPIKSTLGISFRLNRWFLVAWLLPPVMAFASFGISLLFPGTEYTPNMEGMLERLRNILTPAQIEQMRNQAVASSIPPIWLALFQGLIAGISINAVAAFGEELGWRGFLLRQWKGMGFWKSSALIGLVWGIWHAPLILQGHNYPQHPVAGVFMMTIWCVLMSPIFSYIRLRSKSVLAAAVIHGSINGTYGLSFMMLKGGNDLLIGSPGLAGFVVLAFVNIGLVLHNLFWAKERVENYM